MDEITMQEIFRIDSLDDIKGQSVVINQMRSFAEDINTSAKRKPLLLYGPTGVGKTSAAITLAKRYKWHIIEVSAADYRDSASISSLYGAAMSRDIFGRRNLFLFDEIDELASKFDSGAESAILKLISMSKNPIIFTATDLWDSSIKFIKDRCEPLYFKPLSSSDIRSILAATMKRIGCQLDPKVVDYIVDKSGGDARSALNDFYVLIDFNDDPSELLGTRNAKISIFRLLDKIFYSSKFSAPIAALSAYEEDINSSILVNWIDENIPVRYRETVSIKKALDNLALSTIFSSRITRRQYYGYLRYINVLMSSGVTFVNRSSIDNSQPYKFPSFIKKLSTTKPVRAQLLLIAASLNKLIHQSARTIVINELPIISLMLRKASLEKIPYEEFWEQKQLSKEDIKFLLSYP
ncbi:MAG: AAA family ATPase [Candidatus Micrarchaeia archaeon]